MSGARLGQAMTAHGTSSIDYTRKRLDRFVSNCVLAVAAGGDDVVLRVRGTCMDPVLEDGKSVRVRQAKWYLPGDVITYYCPYLKRCLIHRFLGYVPADGSWKCLTMSDHGSKPDVLVETANILGKVIDNRPGMWQRCRSWWRYAYWTVRIALTRG